MGPWKLELRPGGVGVSASLLVTLALNARDTANVYMFI